MSQTLKTRGSNPLWFLTAVVLVLCALSVSSATAQTKPWFSENSYWLRGPVERFDRDTAHSVVRLLKKAIQGHEQSRIDLIALHSRFIESDSSALRLDERVAGMWKELPGLPKIYGSDLLGLLLDKELHWKQAGVLVTAVDPGFQPDEIRIFPGDRILTINEIPVTSASDVIRLTRSNPPGKFMRLTLERDSGDKDITMTPRSPASLYDSGLAYAVLFESAMVLEELIRAGLAPDSQLIFDLLSMIDFHSDPLNDSVWSRATRINVLNSLGVLIRSVGAGLESGSLEWTESLANTVSRIILKAHFLSRYQVMFDNSNVSWRQWSRGQGGLIRLLSNLQEKSDPHNLLGKPMLRAITATYDFPFIYDHLQTKTMSDQARQAIGVISDFNTYTYPVIYEYGNFLPLIKQLKFVADSYELIFLERFDWASIDEGLRQWAMVEIRQFHTTMSIAYMEVLKTKDVVPAHLEEIETFHQRIKRFRQKNVTFFEAHNATDWKDGESARRLGEDLFWFKEREVDKAIDLAEVAGRYEDVLAGQRKLVSLARSALGGSHRMTLSNTNVLLHSLGGFGLVDEARGYIDEIRPHYKDEKELLDKEIKWAGFLNEKEKEIALIERYRDIYAPNLAESNFPLAYDLLNLYTSNAPQKLKARSGKLLVAQMKKALSETKAGWAPGEGAPRDDEERYDNEQYKKFSLLGITLADAFANENHQALITVLADVVNMVSSELGKDGSINPHYRNFPVTLAFSLGALGHESTAAELLRKTIALFEQKEKLYQGDIAVASILLAGHGANKGEHIESRQYLNKARNIFSSGAPIVVPDNVSESLLRGIAVILNLSIRDGTPLDVAVAIADDEIRAISDNANGLSAVPVPGFEALTPVTPAMDLSAAKLTASKQRLRRWFLEAVYRLDVPFFLSYKDGKFQKEVESAFLKGDTEFGSLYARVAYASHNYAENIRVSEKMFPNLVAEYRKLLSGIDVMRLAHTDQYSDFVYSYAAALISTGQSQQAFGVIDTFKSTILASTISIEEQVIVSAKSRADVRLARQLKAELAGLDNQDNVTLGDRGETEGFENVATHMVATLKKAESLRQKLEKEGASALSPYTFNDVSDAVTNSDFDAHGDALFLHYFAIGTQLWFASYHAGRFSGGELDYTVDEPLQQQALSSISSRGKRGFTKDVETSALSIQSYPSEFAKLIPREISGANGIRRLFISPDQTTANVPFSAIRIGAEYLIDRYQIGLAPSLQTVALFRNRRDLFERSEPMELLGIGLSDFSSYNRKHDASFVDLVNTEREIAAVTKLFPAASVTTMSGTEATESALVTRSVSGELNNYRYLLFSTHGVVSQGIGTKSYLVLNPDETKSNAADGKLTVSDIAKLDISADVVFLSACETALGVHKGSEGAMGLPYAFFLAGGSSVVASLWKIDDHATRLFVTEFFRILRSDPDRNTIAALSETKRAFANGRFPSYKDPAYWSAFIIYGGL